jgi:O-antigen/teichoic acid export membrane protein
MEKKKLKDLRFILKNSGWIGSGQFSNILLRYIYTIIGTRFLGAANYGFFVIGRSIIKFTSTLGEFGLGVAIQRQVAFYSAKNDVRKISQSIGLGILLSLLNSIILAVLVFSFSDLIALKIFKNVSLAFILKLFSIAIPIITLLRIFYHIFQGYKQVKYRVFLEYFAVHLANIFLLVVMMLLGLELAGIIWAFIIANFMALLGAIVIYGRMKTSIEEREHQICDEAGNRNITNLAHEKKEDNPANLFSVRAKINSKAIKIEKDTAKELISYAAPLVFTSTLNFLQRWADTFLLALLSTGLAVGIYNVSLRLSEFVAVPLIAFNMIFSPMIAEIYAQKDIDRLKFNYQVVTKLTYTLSLLIYSVILLFPAELLSMFGGEFKNATTVLIVLCIGQLINASVGASGWMLVMTGHPKIELFNSIVFVMLTICLNLILIPRYNVLGAGIANAITLSIVNLSRVVQIYRVLRIHPFRWDYLKPLAAILVSITIIIYLKKMITVNLVTFFLLLVILVVIYVLIIFLLGIKTEEQWLLSQVKKKMTSFKDKKNPGRN